MIEDAMIEGGSEPMGKSQMVSYKGVALVLLFALMVVAIAYLASLFTSSREVVKKQEHVIKTAVEALDRKTEQVKTLQADLEKINKRMEGIKTSDDFLRRDIFEYIDRNFQIIPKSVSVDIAEQIFTISKKEDICPELIVGIIEVESSFNPMAISKKNARGLMQVMPEWAKKFGLKLMDLHDIDTNIQTGIKVLKIHIEENKGSIRKGLYYYVGKSNEYSKSVYEAMGKFVAFRSTLADDDIDTEVQTENGGEVTETKNGDTTK
jgi:Na+-transporting methylmalonyl-CoA/oxaloacetate decarboxylase gamma subunit